MMQITLQCIFQRICLLKKRVFSLVNYLKRRIVLISQCIGKHILLIRKCMLLLVNYLKKGKRSIFILTLKASAFSVLLLFSLYKTRVSGSFLSTNIQNVALKATMHCICDETAQQSKVSSKVIKNTAEYSLPQSQESQERISPLVENVSTEVKNIENLTLIGSENHKSLEIETVHTIPKKFRRYFYFGMNPSRVMFHWGNVAFDLLEHKISVSRSLRPLITCLKDNITIGHFSSTRTTSRGDHAHSRAMFWRTYVEQEHHLLMFRQMIAVYRHVDPRHMFVLLYNFLHPEEPFPPIPVLDEDGINAVGFLTRAYFFPGYLAGNVGDIPVVINVQNHMLVPNNRIKSWNSGFIFEFKPLNPTLLLLEQQGFWAKYLQRHVNVTLRHTRTNLIKTNMVDTRVNLSGVGLDVFRSIISRTPVIKKTTPIVNRLSLLAQEFITFEVRLEAGLEHSDVVNFNITQELLRTARMARYNLIIRNNMQQREQQREVTFFQPMNRRNYANHLAEIHSRSFYNVGFVITMNFNLFGKLAKFTNLKNQ